MTVLRRDGAVARRIAIFSFGVVLAWMLLAWPAYWFGGGWGLAGSGTSALVCLVPGWITLYVGGRLEGDFAVWFLALGGMLVRLLFILGAGVGLYFVFDGFTPRNLLIWLVTFYSITLALETSLVVGPIASSQTRHDGSRR